MKSFGELFNESWKEYKTNFKVYSVIIFLFLFIPSIIIVAAGIPLTAHIYNLDSNIDYSFLEIFKPSLITPLILIWIISLILQFFVTASFLYNSLFKKQNKVMTVKETLSGGRKYFWKVFGFSVVTAILLIFLTLAFIIPGIIFMIFWIFAAYILVNENTGIIESLKKSYYLVKGRWWRTFGFLQL